MEDDNETDAGAGREVLVYSHACGNHVAEPRLLPVQDMPAYLPGGFCSRTGTLGQDRIAQSLRIIWPRLEASLGRECRVRRRSGFDFTGTY